MKILGHFSVPPTSCHTKTINKNTASLILFDIEYCLHTNVSRKSIVHLKLVQYSLILGSPVPCSSDSWFLTQAIVGWKYQSYCRAMHFQGNKGKWNQLEDKGRTKEFSVVTEGSGGRLEKLFHSRAEWEIWKGSVSKTEDYRPGIRFWFWDIGGYIPIGDCTYIMLAFFLAF